MRPLLSRESDCSRSPEPARFDRAPAEFVCQSPAADRALRQYAADPANRLVTGELEARWNKALARVAEVEAKIAAHDAATVPSTVDPASFTTLTADLKSVWTDPTTMHG